MPTILQQLYGSSLGVEAMEVEDPGRQEQVDCTRCAYEALEHLLTPPQMSAFRSYETEHGALIGYETEQMFINGVRLGAQLILELLRPARQKEI